MTRNNTLNKVHVAATELPQLLSQNTKSLIFGEEAEASPSTYIIPDIVAIG